MEIWNYSGMEIWSLRRNDFGGKHEEEKGAEKVECEEEAVEMRYEEALSIMSFIEILLLQTENKCENGDFWSHLFKRWAA
jgi:hypothetical protein